MSGWVNSVVTDAYLTVGWVLLSFLHSMLLPSSLPSFYPSLFSSFRSLLLSPFSPFLPSFSSCLSPSFPSSFLPASHIPFSPSRSLSIFSFLLSSPPLFSSWTATEAGTGDAGRKKWETSIELQRCKDQSPRPLELSCMSAVATRLNTGTSDTRLALNSGPFLGPRPSSQLPVRVGGLTFYLSIPSRNLNYFGTFFVTSPLAFYVFPNL